MLWRALVAAIVVAVSVYVAFIARSDSRARAGGAPVECTGSESIDFACYERRYATLV